MGRLTDAWGVLTGSKEIAGPIVSDVVSGPIVDLAAEPLAERALISTIPEPEQRAFGGEAGLLSVGLASGGGRRGTRGMLQAHSDIPGVRSIVEHIAGSVASVPWSAYRVKRGKSSGRSRTVRTAQKHIRNMVRGGERRDVVIRQMLEAEELQELPNHPAIALIDKPNGALTSEQVLATLQMHIEYTGNAFLLLERLGRSGRPFEMWPIPPTWVQPQTQINSPMPSSYSVNGGPFQLGSVAVEDLVWIKNPDPKDPYDYGSGLAASLNNEIDADEQAAMTVSAFMRNRGIPSGILSFENAKPETLAPLQEEWNQKYGGPKNSGRLAFTGYKIQLEQLTQSLVDMDVVALRRFLREVQTEHFCIPPETMGRVENSNRATITVAQQIFAIYVLVRRLDRLQDAFNTWLVPLFGDEDVLVLYENPVPDDEDFRLDAAKAAPWALSLNEWRKRAGEAPLEGPEGDAHFIPFTSQAVLPANMLEQTMRPEPEPAPAAEEEEEEDKAIPPGVSKADDGRIGRVVAALKPKRLIDRAKSVMRERIVSWFRRIALEIGSSIDILQIRQLVETHLAEWASERIAKLVNATTRRALRAALVSALARGDDLKAMEAKVSQVFATAKASRALTIASTEVVRSANWASTAVHQAGGIAARVWINMADPRVREAHVYLGGQVRSIQDPFMVPAGKHAGAIAMHPGTFGIAELDVNCRCVTVPYFGEQRSQENMDGLWKQFDADIRPWERALAQAIRRGFDDQEQDVLAELRRVFGGKA